MVTVMRFSQDSLAANSIRAYRDDEITINDRIITESVVITPDTIELWAPRRVTELTSRHMQQLGELQPEIVILGTGPALQFPAPALLVGLQTQAIGVEVMAHDAACRTFNILLAEDRRVVAALMMGGADTQASNTRTPATHQPALTGRRSG
jgi:uncharacterized protein